MVRNYPVSENKESVRPFLVTLPRLLNNEFVYDVNANGKPEAPETRKPEIPDLKAGDLVHLALEGIGDGGGHAMMAGGVIFPDKLIELGDKADAVIRRRFLKALKETRKKA